MPTRAEILEQIRRQGQGHLDFLGGRLTDLSGIANRSTGREADLAVQEHGAIERAVARRKALLSEILGTLGQGELDESYLPLAQGALEETNAGALRQLRERATTQVPAGPQGSIDSVKAAIERLKQVNPSYSGSEAGSTTERLVSDLERGLQAGQDPNQIAQVAKDIINRIQDVNYSQSPAALQEQIGKIGQSNIIPLERAQEQFDIKSLADKQAAEREQTRQQVLARIPALRQELGSDLLKQQNYAYEQIRPQIEQRLNAMGILQSGALPEAQTRAFRDLENARQARLSDFSTQATQDLELGLPLSSLYQTQGQHQQALQGGIDLTRAGITRGYQERDLEKQYALQRELSMQALQEARDARNQADRTARRGQWIGGISNVISGAAQGAGAFAGRYSDSRLKTGIEQIDTVEGFGIFKFRWNDKARSMGAPTGSHIGVMAQDVEQKMPEAVNVLHDFKMVDYALLPVKVIEVIKWHSNFQRQ